MMNQTFTPEPGCSSEKTHNQVFLFVRTLMDIMHLTPYSNLKLILTLTLKQASEVIRTDQNCSHKSTELKAVHTNKQSFLPLSHVCCVDVFASLSFFLIQTCNGEERLQLCSNKTIQLRDICCKRDYSQIRKHVNLNLTSRQSSSLLVLSEPVISISRPGADL